MRAKIARNPDGTRLAVIRCPGCNDMHHVRVDGPHKWGFNESLSRPTFTPSVVVRGTATDQDDPDAKALEFTCHFIVTDGRIAFCADSTHALSGQVVDLPELQGSA